MPIVVAPGSQRNTGAIRPIAAIIYEMEACIAQRLELSRGSHRGRIRNATEFPSWNQCMCARDVLLPVGVVSSPLPAVSLLVDDMDGSCKPLERR